MVCYKLKKISLALFLFLMGPSLFACENILSDFRLSALTSAEQKIVIADHNGDLFLLKVGENFKSSLRLEQVLEEKAILSCIQAPDKKLIWYYDQGFDNNRVDVMDVLLPTDEVLSAIQD